jgi:hypothetical protein
MTQFMFPATLATLLRSRTYMGEIAIASTVKRRLADGEAFTILTTRGGNDHYRVWPVPGKGFRVRPWKLSAITNTMCSGR